MDDQKYLHFLLDTPEEECRKAFFERYGYEPEKCEQVIKGLMKNKVWGWWQCGPVVREVTE